MSLTTTEATAAEAACTTLTVSIMSIISQCRQSRQYNRDRVGVQPLASRSSYRLANRQLYLSFELTSLAVS